MVLGEINSLENEITSLQSIDFWTRKIIISRIISISHKLSQTLNIRQKICGISDIRGRNVLQSFKLYIASFGLFERVWSGFLKFLKLPF